MTTKKAVKKTVKKTVKKAVKRKAVKKKKTYKKSRKGIGGRPPAVTPEVIRLLEEAFAWGCSDREACVWAGISTTAFYEWQKKNKKFTERKETLKETPIMKARKAVVEALPSDPELSLKFLERKKKDEFSLKHEVDNNHKGTMQIVIPEGQQLKGLLSDEF